ncbi:hypothetical protein GN316_14650 [Xylophilus sp. Kf1]|nr:hypothetical protein [Xylophilus sp. Kf1]
MAPAGPDKAADVDRFWLGFLSLQARVIGEPDFADILEKTNWMPQELQASLARLIEAGQVHNLDAHRPRRTSPLHPKNSERLVRLSQS